MSSPESLAVASEAYSRSGRGASTEMGGSQPQIKPMPNRSHTSSSQKKGAAQNSPLGHWVLPVWSQSTGAGGLGGPGGLGEGFGPGGGLGPVLTG